MIRTIRITAVTLLIAGVGLLFGVGLVTAMDRFGSGQVLRTIAFGFGFMLLSKLAKAVVDDIDRQRERKNGQ